MNFEVLIACRFHEWIKTYHHEPDVVPIASFITKIDIDLAPDSAEKLKKIEDFCKLKGWIFEKTSAKMNINVQESFEKLIK